MSDAAIAGICAVITAVGAIAVTVFNYLTARDYGSTVKETLVPASQAITSSQASVNQIGGLMKTMMEQHGSAMQNIAAQQVAVTTMITRIDERTRVMETYLS